VGYNIASALTRLGGRVRLASLVGRDEVGQLARQALAAAQVADDAVLDALDQTCQSLILYDESGRRAIFTDLKDIQERAYPSERFAEQARGCALAVICNINFARPLLAQAQALGLPIVSDVHALADLDDSYNQDYMAAAEVLFLSHERLPTSPEEFARAIQQRFGTPIVVVGMGAEGALLALRREQTLARVSAIAPRGVVSTVGAGDALLSAFVDGYARGLEPLRALRRATLFAGHKVGSASGAAGLLTADELAQLEGEHL
jgi:acarbose 7IV-phosphotransferase